MTTMNTSVISSDIVDAFNVNVEHVSVNMNWTISLKWDTDWEWIACTIRNSKNVIMRSSIG